MLDQIVGVIFVCLATVISNLEKLVSNDSITVAKRAIPKKSIGMCLIAISIFGLTIQMIQSFSKEREVRRLRQVILDTNSTLFNEASGGSAIGDLAYIVDDEKEKIFKLRFSGVTYEFAGEIQLKEGEKALARDDQEIVEDLEAAATCPGQSYNRKLYLIASHSNTKKGKDRPARQRLLEVSLEPGKEGEIIKSADTLRAAILDEFKILSIEPYKNNNGETEVMQIEGLAIDGEGYAYLGFRAPLREDKSALVLRAKLADLFSVKPRFEPFFLNLGSGEKNYGITSIDYDAQTNSMLILGNSSDGSGFFPPTLWQWDFTGKAKEDPIQNPRKCGEILYATLSRLSSATPELLLLPPASTSSQIFMFLDADDKGDGGQLSIKRNDYGLGNGGQ